MSASSIPIVDFSSLSLNHTDDELDETNVKITASEIMNAFSTAGYVYLSNTHFPQQLVSLPTNIRLTLNMHIRHVEYAYPGNRDNHQ